MKLDIGGKEPLRVVIEFRDIGSFIRINYFDKTYQASVCKCSRVHEKLDNEVVFLTRQLEESCDVFTIIPENIVTKEEILLRVIQGCIHYILYSNEFKVKNRGLLLAMLILGHKQLADVIDNLNKAYASSSSYFLVIINPDKACPSNCKGLAYSTIEFKRKFLSNLAKNILALIERI
ncbi:MAG: hypothetical protein ABWW65_04725 [Thermoprotei archaeon]